MSYDLQDNILSINNIPQWKLEHAVQGVQIFGGIGSGKTTGSGQFLAKKYLEKGYGGLVLTVKPDECAQWENYCKKTGRSKDLIIVDPKHDNCFNFLDYETYREGDGAGLTENLVKTLKTVIKAGDMDKGHQSDDAFWEDAIDLHLFNTIDLCILGFGEITIDILSDVYRSTPKNLEKLKDEKWREKSTFHKAYKKARDKAKSNELDDAQLRILQKIDNYFFSEFLNLHEKTRSIVEYSLTGLLFRLTREPVYSLFCAEQSNFIPEDCINNGKIILINLPVKEYDKVGKDCQILFKYIWQRTMERRKVDKDGGRPVFLWADEAQNFIHEHDINYQATSRSSLVCTVYLTQNIPNYYAQIGGANGQWLVKSFLGTMGTKIFHANADVETNTYASKLLGEIYIPMKTASRTKGKDYTETDAFSWQKTWEIAPEKFVAMRSGGKALHFKVDAVIHRQGTPWDNGENYIRTSFNQNF